MMILVENQIRNGDNMNRLINSVTSMMENMTAMTRACTVMCETVSKNLISNTSNTTKKQTQPLQLNEQNELLCILILMTSGCMYDHCATSINTPNEIVIYMHGLYFLAKENGFPIESMGSMNMFKKGKKNNVDANKIRKEVVKSLGLNTDVRSSRYIDVVDPNYLREVCQLTLVNKKWKWYNLPVSCRRACLSFGQNECQNLFLQIVDSKKPIANPIPTQNWISQRFPVNENGSNIDCGPLIQLEKMLDNVSIFCQLLIYDPMEEALIRSVIQKILMALKSHESYQPFPDTYTGWIPIIRPMGAFSLQNPNNSSEIVDVVKRNDSVVSALKNIEDTSFTMVGKPLNKLSEFWDTYARSIAEIGRAHV